MHVYIQVKYFDLHIPVHELLLKESFFSARSRGQVPPATVAQLGVEELDLEGKGEAMIPPPKEINVIATSNTSNLINSSHNINNTMSQYRILIKMLSTNSIGWISQDPFSNSMMLHRYAQTR